MYEIKRQKLFHFLQKWLFLNFCVAPVLCVFYALSVRGASLSCILCGELREGNIQITLKECILIIVV